MTGFPDVAPTVGAAADPSWIEALAAMGMLPPRYRGPDLGLSWSEVDYPDKYVGALWGGACGDALGRPGEGLSRERIRSLYGSLIDFQPLPGHQRGPLGIITDDTQMTMEVAASIVAERRVDPADIARRFVDWLPRGRGRGRTCVAAVQNLMAAMPWYEAGVDSAGNGAAMRVAPVGLLDAVDIDRLRVDAALTAVVTHRNHLAVASAVAQAFSVAYCLHREPSQFDPSHLIDALLAALGDLADPGTRERRPGARPRLVRLVEKVGEVAELEGATPEAAFRRLHNGAFVLESFPAALWCFLRHHDDPEAAIVVAANGGYDADTVAAMTGNVAGALHGASRLPRRWVAELEFREELACLATDLLGLARGG